MPFQVSPGVNVSEIDLTNVIPAVSSTEGAIAGVFKWGPVETRVLVDSAASLVSSFGKPTRHANGSTFNVETFFTAQSFLSYGNKLYVSRTAEANAYNAQANSSAAAAIQIKNVDDHAENFTANTNAHFYAKYPGALGNSLKVNVCGTAAAYAANVDMASETGVSAAELTFVPGNTTVVFTVTSSDDTDRDTTLTTFNTTFNVGDNIKVGDQTYQITGHYANATGGYTGAATDDYSYSGMTFSNTMHANAEVGASALSVNSTVTEVRFEINKKYSGVVNAIAAGAYANGVASNNIIQRSWEHSNLFDKAPGISATQASNANTTAAAIVDEMHVVVIDEDGEITGTADTVLETWTVSRNSDAKSENGADISTNAIDNGSEWLWVGNGIAGLAVAEAGAADGAAAATATNPIAYSFTDGVNSGDEASIGLSALQAGYDLYKNPEEIDVSLILAGKARGATLANYLIDEIAEPRKDCMVFISPDRADVVDVAASAAADNIIDFRNTLSNSSYAVLDSGYKYMYDKYNDKYEYVPLNGDIAGTVVRTDSQRDPWFSPAGFNRGGIKNIVKLAYTPTKAQRDVLYKADVNPVVTFPGQGTVLFGDKTLLGRPSAFDRINVRRLFIVLEKAIATAANNLLFEFNDDFTRAQFVNTVEPFLREVQGRRGIFDFSVVADDTNNTGEVIDRSEFIGDIYIKPARSINFIQLNFVAVRTGVEFEEIVGQF